MTDEKQPPRRWASRKEAIAYAKVGTTKFHELINQKLIVARRLGSKTIIDLDSIDALFESLPPAGNRAA